MISSIFTHRYQSLDASIKSLKAKINHSKQNIDTVTYLFEKASKNIENIQSNVNELSPSTKQTLYRQLEKIFARVDLVNRNEIDRNEVRRICDMATKVDRTLSMAHGENRSEVVKETATGIVVDMTLCTRTAKVVESKHEAERLDELTVSPSLSIEVLPPKLDPSLLIENKLRLSQSISSHQLQKIMTQSFGGSDAENRWTWKDGYEAVEKAIVRYISNSTNQLTLDDVITLEKLCPTHTRRTENQALLQQFSTPITISYIVAIAAGITKDDVVLEPSAGNGMLAVWANKIGAELILNEICPMRSVNLKELFREATILELNGEYINDYLPQHLSPTVVIVNPPFSSSQDIEKRNPEATFNHLYSAYSRLPSGGRLVAITADWFSPNNPKWQKAFARFEETGQVVFSTPITGKLYRKHGTNIFTRLTVWDKGVSDSTTFVSDVVCESLERLLDLVLANVPKRLQPIGSKAETEAKMDLVFSGDSQIEQVSNHNQSRSNNVIKLLLPTNKNVNQQNASVISGNETVRQLSLHGCNLSSNLVKIDRVVVPNSDHAVAEQSSDRVTALQDDITSTSTRINRISNTPLQQDKLSLDLTEESENELEHNCNSYTNNKIDWQDIQPVSYRIESITTSINDDLYQQYQPQSISIDNAIEHPTTLVQSVAMASVKPPLPTYQPLLPSNLVTDGILSASQLESIIYAGEAHNSMLSRYFLVDCNKAKLKLSTVETSEAVNFRRGWLLGDGTGSGKGRQSAGIILDNWLQGRKKALWISKTDKLIEDARRDWCALGGDEKQIISLSKYKQGEAIDLNEGIIFATYATLRSQAKQGKISRVEQLINWLGKDFDGVIIFDECHAMGGALAMKGSRGVQKPSQQGLAGLKLQYGLALARVVYVSATGATEVANLAYATRLGLWMSEEFPFTCADDFVSSVNEGGLAAMEVVSRDLKSLGLYASRSLSYHGVQYDILEHELTPEQIVQYDAYAEAYKIIHQNIQQALEVTHIVSTQGKSRNTQAKSAVHSAFEGNKQRFFNHLLSAMKMPTLIKAIEKDLKDGCAVVIQIVSTNEALLNRRLADIPTSEWNDLNIDITPREYIFDYLMHAFPVQLHQVYSDDEGVEQSKPAYDGEGNPIMSIEALAKRDRLIESLALLPPIPGCLDLIIQHFGHNAVAEVTGRSKRIIRDTTEGKDVLKVSTRSSTSNLVEVRAFQNDEKQILVFSDAGGTGASYHASLTEKNQRQRIHYLLEAGWRADTAIQGLGRSHRSNQKQPPVFRPVTTNVKGEKRFTSTIAKRLDSLGALTKGQRQTGSQGIFSEEDNLESIYARTSLHNLYYAIYLGKLPFCSLAQFESATGLSLTAKDSHAMKENLPPMNQFLNRLLALPVNLQNQLFEVFSMGLSQAIEVAKENGTYETGVEVMKAESLTIAHSTVIYTHNTGATTSSYKIIRRERNEILTFKELLANYSNGRFLRNDRSGNIALAIPTNSILEDDGSISDRISLIRPNGNQKIKVSDFESSHWQEIDRVQFERLWTVEANKIPKLTESSFYLITGLLLPIWKHLDTDSLKVWRMRTDDGQNLLGRVVYSNQIGAIYESLGIDRPSLSAEEIYDAILRSNEPVNVGRWRLKTSRVMNKTRIEFVDFDRSSDVQLLKTYGCFSEMINWKLRLFIPMNDSAIPILRKIHAL